MNHLEIEKIKTVEHITLKTITLLREMKAVQKDEKMHCVHEWLAATSDMN